MGFIITAEQRDRIGQGRAQASLSAPRLTPMRRTTDWDVTGQLAAAGSQTSHATNISQTSLEPRKLPRIQLVKSSREY